MGRSAAATDAPDHGVAARVLPANHDGSTAHAATAHDHILVRHDATAAHDDIVAGVALDHRPAAAVGALTPDDGLLRQGAPAVPTTVRARARANCFIFATPKEFECRWQRRRLADVPARLARARRAPGLG